jgi:hypothetical protein
MWNSETLALYLTFLKGDAFLGAVNVFWYQYNTVQYGSSMVRFVPLIYYDYNTVM